MIFLDGSNLPFDPTKSVSRTLISQRERLSLMPNVDIAKEVKEAIGKHYGVLAEYISLSMDKIELINRVTDNGEELIASEDDKALGDQMPNIELIPNLPDMRPNINKLIEKAGEGKTIYLSNPAFPSSLLLSSDDIERIANAGKLIVDESFILSDDNSLIKLCLKNENITIIKRFDFADNLYFAIKKNAPFGDNILAESAAKTLSVLEHPASLRNAQQKLSDSAQSLYIRIKKLAIRYKSVNRLYHSRAGYTFFKVSDRESRGEALKASGVTVYEYKDYFAVFAGTPEENEMALNALSKALE